jgi:hypothetical protein
MDIRCVLLIFLEFVMDFSWYLTSKLVSFETYSAFFRRDGTLLSLRIGWRSTLAAKS